MIELSIMSADTKRELDKPLKIMRAINSQIENIEREREKTEYKEKWIEQIFNTLKNEMETSVDSVVHTFYLNDFVTPKILYSKEYILTECFEIVAQLFEEAGYETYFHEYSSSWKNQSGRFGWFGIYWR